LIEFRPVLVAFPLQAAPAWDITGLLRPDRRPTLFGSCFRDFPLPEIRRTAVMNSRNARRINGLGHSLIRIIIASYLMAASLELIDGVHPSALFAHMRDADVANILGSFILFMGAYLLMCGLAVRLVSIYLALLVLGSSIMQNFVLPDVALIDLFWRDLVLTAALILNYGTLTERELARAAFVREALHVRRVGTNAAVTPRRVAATLPDTKARTATPVRPPAARTAPPPAYLLADAQDPVENIFA
jgi:uncharacterized membrane protein YphA (DoxX/SURF4 family)